MFPEKPTCHAGSSQAERFSEHLVWRPQRIAPAVDATWPETHRTTPGYEKYASTDDDIGRTCGYCGSLHPEDLLRALQAGAKLGGSDWKYGYPHKFYVEMPNPSPDKLYSIGSANYAHEGEGWLRSADGKESFLIGKRLTLHGKRYNDHLLDKSFSDEKWQELTAALEKHAGILFFLEEGHLKYRAPHHGYQR